MSATSSRLPVELARRLRRSRRAVLRRLPKSAKRRLRFAKWAVVGPPPGAAPGKKIAKPKAAVLAKVGAPEPRKAAAAVPPGSVPSAIPADMSAIEVRQEFVLASIDRNTATVLEIGPAHNPTLPKCGGFKTKNVDHLDQAGLVEKYKPHPGVQTENIEAVDYVLAPGDTMAVSISERFDLVLASHVIEHTTSLVHFINECSQLLTAEGTLCLITPDQRFCFDRFRERSSLGAVIDASLQPGKVHSLGTLMEYAYYAAYRGGAIAWGPGQQGRYRAFHDLDYVREFAATADDGTYFDVHHWVFTPHHLRLLLHDLADLGYISVRESAFHNTVGCEFFLNLRVDGPGPGASRQQLLELADAERRSLDVPVFESV